MSAGILGVTALSAPQNPTPYGNCSTATNVDGLIIYNWSVIPMCLLAVFIGIVGGRLIRKAPAYRGAWSYSISFYMYAVMMWHSMLAHTVTYSLGIQWFINVVMIIDAGLTSSIAISFFWNGLIDLRLIDDRKKCARPAILLSYLMIIGAWAYAILKKVPNAFMVLYVGVIAVCCGLFMLAQFVVAMRNRKFSRFLLSAGLFGAAGFWSMLNGAKLCAKFGPTWNGSFWWDLFSDLAMWALLYFYFDTRVDPSEDVVVNPSCRRGGESCCVSRAAPTAPAAYVAVPQNAVEMQDMGNMPQQMQMQIPAGMYAAPVAFQHIVPAGNQNGAPVFYVV